MCTRISRKCVETQRPRPHLRLSESESPKHLTSFFRGTGKTHGHLVERADVPSRSPRGTRRSKAALNLFWSKDPLGAREGPVRGRRGRPCKQPEATWALQAFPWTPPREPLMSAVRRTNPAKEADKESPGRWGTRRREDEGPSRGGEAVTQEDVVSGDDAPSERATREPKSTRRDREAARRGPGAEFGVSEGQSQVPVGDRRASEWRGRARTWAGARSPQPNARSGRRLRV